MSIVNLLLGNRLVHQAIMNTHTRINIYVHNITKFDKLF